MAVLAAKRLGAKRIIAMSRHPERQALAELHGATDIVQERGEEGVERIKSLTGGLGAHSVVEPVGTHESTLQPIGATRPGGHIGRVGVNYKVTPRMPLFFAATHTHGGPAPVRRSCPTSSSSSGTADRPRQGLRPHPPARPDSRGYNAMDERRTTKVLLTL